MNSANDVYYYRVLYGTHNSKKFHTLKEAKLFVECAEKFKENCVIFLCKRRYNGTFSWTCVYDTLKERVYNE